MFEENFFLINIVQHKSTFRGSLSLLSHQKCLRNHKRIFMDANKHLSSLVLGLGGEVMLMVSKIKDLLPGIIVPAPGGKYF